MFFRRRQASSAGFLFCSTEASSLFAFEQAIPWLVESDIAIGSLCVNTLSREKCRVHKAEVLVHEHESTLRSLPFKNFIRSKGRHGACRPFTPVPGTGVSVPEAGAARELSTLLLGAQLSE